jgi:hypothetical protein
MGRYGAVSQPENHEHPDSAAGEPLRLGQVGQLYVTQEAALLYARRRYLLVEEARRELTAFLLDAKRSGVSLGFWRRRTDRLDVSARVGYERGLLLVVSVAVCDGPRR